MTNDKTERIKGVTEGANRCSCCRTKVADERMTCIWR